MREAILVRPPGDDVEVLGPQMSVEDVFHVRRF